MQLLHHLLLGLIVVGAELLGLLLWGHVLGLLVIQLVHWELVELVRVLEHHAFSSILISEWVLILTTKRIILPSKWILVLSFLLIQVLQST